MTNVQANGESCRDVALLALELGLSPGYPKQDGSKAPDGPWKKYQTTPADRPTVEGWYDRGATGVGLFTGYDDVELFEFDCRPTYDRFKDAAVAFGLGDLVGRIEAGYLEDTPGGGVHWFWYCEAVVGNTRLAERPESEGGFAARQAAEVAKAALEGRKPKAITRGREPLIETRGVGGWAVIAPSNGTVHPTGGAYKLVSGGLDSIVTITPDEREALFALARSFDEIPAKLPDPPKPKGRPKSSGRKDGVTPLDDFNARGDRRGVLEGLGWTLARTIGAVEYWRRPDKAKGWSATWGHTKGFRVFTSSTALATGSHTLANVYCVLEHQGDWTACVKDLVAKGYGTWIDDEGEEHQNPPPPDVKPGGKPEGKDAGNGDGGDYITTKNGVPRSCMTNSETWVRIHRPGLQFAYDSFRNDVLVDGNPFTEEKSIEITKAIEAALGTPWTRDHVWFSLVDVAHRHTYSSLGRYLESLRWDGVNRLESFFPDHYEVADTPYHREVGRVLFLSAAARGLDPGCKVDTVPLLIGNQGLHKSLGIAALCPHPEWFTDNIGDLHGGAETAKRLAGKWLIELGELAAMRRSEIEYVKSFVSIQSDNYRPSYGRRNQDFRRACIFIGTTNSDQPLQDVENRRFLPVPIDNKGNVAAIEAARDELWAEAAHRYRSGEKWWTTDPTLAEVAREQSEARRAADAWEDLLRQRLHLHQRTTVADAANLLGIEPARLDKSVQTRIGPALAAIGFKREREPRPSRAYYYERIDPTST